MASRLRVLLLAGPSVGAALLCGGEAAAQSPATPPTSSGSAPSSQDAQAGAATAPVSVGEVIVTANRRAQSVQNVAAEVTAVTGAQLERLHTRTLEEFAGFVPGLSFQQTSPGVTLIAIRGVTTGTQANSSVGLYLDDVPLGTSSSFGQGSESLSINSFDLARVEVLNGPQGTLYGANALGGAVKYVTTAPNLNKFGGILDVEGSLTDHAGGNDGFRLMLNAPIIEGRLALRVDGIDQYDSGFVNDPTHDRTHQGAGRTLGYRASLLAEITPALDVRITAFDEQVRVRGINVVERDNSTHEPVGGELTQNFPVQQGEYNEIRLVSATINYDFGFAKLTSITAAQRSDIKNTSDVSALYSTLLGGVLGPAAVAPYAVPLDIFTRKLSEEVRLASPSNKVFEWTVGAFYTHEDSQEFTAIQDARVPNGYLLGLFPLFASTIPTTYEEIAGFADGTYYVTPKLDLTLGVRYSHNKQTFTQNTLGLVNNPAAPFTETSVPNGSSEDVVTYLINPKYRFNSNAQVYFRAASGYRPGGPNFAVGPVGGPPFKADTLWTYELGTKLNLLSRTLTLDAAIYDTEWKGIQLATVVQGVAQLVNAGDARIRGADLGLTYITPIPGLSTFGQFTYTDANLTTTAPPLGVNYEGARLPVSPKYAFALGAAYDFTLGGKPVSLSLSDQYTGSRTSGYAGSTNNILYPLNSYHLLNANFSVKLNDHLELSVFGRNLLNARGELNATTVNQPYIPTAPALVSLVRPLTIGVEARAAF